MCPLTSLPRRRRHASCEAFLRTAKRVSCTAGAGNGTRNPEASDHQVSHRDDLGIGAGLHSGPGVGFLVGRGVGLGWAGGLMQEQALGCGLPSLPHHEAEQPDCPVPRPSGLSTATRPGRGGGGGLHPDRDGFFHGINLSLFRVYYTAADDYDVASSPMQKVILHSLPTGLLRKAHRAVFGSWQAFPSFLGSACAVCCCV